MLYSKYVETYMSQLVNHKSKETLKSEAHAAERFARFLNEDVNIQKITKIHCMDFRDSLDIQSNTVNTYIRFLRAIFDNAVERDLLVQNPFRQIKTLPQVRTKRKAIRSQDWAVIESALKTCSPALRDIVHFALYTGLRRNELINLKTNQIEELKPGRFSIHLKDSTKGGHERYVPLPTQALEIIHRRTTKGNIFSEYSNPQALSKAFQRLMVKLGFNYKLHSLRHSYATNFLENEGRLEDLQRILGHANIATTSIYLDMDDDRIAEDINNRVGFKK